MIAPSFRSFICGATSVASVLFEMMLLDRILANASSVMPDMGP